MALDRFSAPARAWFEATFPAPTAAQAQGWPPIADGDHTLILAPTGSGKTLAAFFWGLDHIIGPGGGEGDGSGGTADEEPDGVGILYISPLRALAVDVEKNLRAPMAGIVAEARRQGRAVRTPTVALRTGDTPAADRRRLVRRPPDLLITTPESLYLMLTSQARETLRTVHTVIIDEIHAVAPTKRGAHLAVSLERLEHLCTTPPQRIGLSATQRPLDEIALFLGGHGADGPRPVTIVDAGSDPDLDVEVVVPVEDMGDLGASASRAADAREHPTGGGAGHPSAATRSSIWPAIHPRLLELIDQHRSTIVFVNARRLAERLAARLNELHLEGENRAAEAEGRSPPEGHELVKAHHGSLSRQRRLAIEDELKRGDLKALVATSSLELGIDMGAVDLVIQVESPGAVSRGLQRIGRAGHQVGEASRGRIFPKHRADLLEAAVVVPRMREGLIESTRFIRNPLDVLAQQIVAMCALDDWPVEDLAQIIRSSAPFTGLSDDVLHATLDLLAGRYPSEEFSELRPRLVWDRVEGVVRARSGAQRLAVTNAGTIPDRGLYGVFLPDGTRVGELDEEMVYESRPGEAFLLGASTWRIEEITPQRVVVTPAPGQPGRMPFWHGDRPGRPLELGRAMGAMVRELRAQGAEEGRARLAEHHGLDRAAADNLMRFLDEQAGATGSVPDDRTIVVERFRDEIGDWRVCVLSPFGSRVHAPWAMALRAGLAARWGGDVEIQWSDDGIVVRLPEAADELPLDALLIDPDEIEGVVTEQLPTTAMFASRFRECAGRSLLLPRRRPDQRTPLWQQRQRAADLLRVAADHPDFPVLLETTRECLDDAFDVPALRQILTDLRSGAVQAVPVDTNQASPFAQSLLFGWIAVYMYEGDVPLAERRATALTLDQDLLRDLLGTEELRELIEPGVLADLELERQRLIPERHARDADEVTDLLRELGPLTEQEVWVRVVGDPTPWFATLIADRRVFRATVGGETRLVAAEDAARVRDGLHVELPEGLPATLLEPVARPLTDLIARFARTHGPFVAHEVARRLGCPVSEVTECLEILADEGRVTRGEFRPEGVEREWCDVEVLRILRRRSLAALRREVEPVEGAALGRFLPAWQGVGLERRGLDGLVEVIGALAGAPLAASVLEADVLAARVGDYRPADLDALCAAGEIVWVGAGRLGDADGRLRLLFRDQVATLAGEAPEPPAEPVAAAILAHLVERGASFWPQIVEAVAAASLPYDDDTVIAAIWELVWAGHLTNDTLAPVRTLLAGSGSRSSSGARGARRPRPGSVRRVGPPQGAGRWSLVVGPDDPTATDTATAHARANQLLARYGVLTREAVLGEGVEGGFAAIYPMLKELEDRGLVRRGYFVEGLGAAQFALPGAVDRLRARRDGGGVVVLAASDPAQPYGSVLGWPESVGRPGRKVGAHVGLVDGRPVVYLERGGRRLVTFPGADESPAWATALAALVEEGRVGRLEISVIDGAPAGESPHAVTLLDAGFTRGYRGLTWRSPR